MIQLHYLDFSRHRQTPTCEKRIRILASFSYSKPAARRSLLRATMQNAVNQLAKVLLVGTGIRLETRVTIEVLILILIAF